LKSVFQLSMEWVTAVKKLNSVFLKFFLVAVLMSTALAFGTLAFFTYLSSTDSQNMRVMPYRIVSNIASGLLEQGYSVEEVNEILSYHRGPPAKLMFELKEVSEKDLDQSKDFKCEKNFCSSKTSSYLRLGDGLVLSRKEPDPRMIARMERRSGQKQAKPKGPPLVPYFIFSSLASLLALFLSFIIVRMYFKKKSNEAVTIMEKLRSGDLKARFKIDKIDEISQMMVLFNSMAEEIELLVEKIKDKENKKQELLQELAHDLKTPIASLRNFTEILSQNRHRLTEAETQELFDLSLGEIEYFSKLVEDLLFLSVMEEPKFSTKWNKVELQALIQEELASIAKPIEVNVEISEKSFVMGDKQLLRRMIKNVINNSADFTTDTLWVKVFHQGDKVVFEVADNGPGFSADHLENYGKRRFSRGVEKDGRISIGLGSVIIRKTVEKHGGNLVVFNGKGSESGAHIRCEFPLGAAA
jgi:signal transduction histidine kinase